MQPVRLGLAFVLILLVGVAAASPKGVRVAPEPAPQGEVQIPVDAVLDMPRGFEPPQNVWLRTSWNHQDNVPCAVENARLVGCRLPLREGPRDLRVEIPGLAPVYRFGEPVRSPGPVELGTLVFERPGRLAVRLTGPDGSLDPEAAEVWLEPEWYEPGGGCTISDPLGLAEVSQLDPADGIEADGLAAGSYLLRVDLPGYAPERRTVEIGSGTTTDLELALVPLVPLEIRLTPPIAPSGGPWDVWLWPGEDSDDEDWYDIDSDRKLVEPGLWRSGPIPPGIYHASLVDADRGDVVGVESVEVRPGATAVEVKVPTVLVEGSVTVGDRPLASVLFFDRTFSARSDDSGAFSVVLPRTGDWVVDVRTEDGSFDVKGLAVTVEATGPRSGRVGLELPTTRLTITVVGEPGGASTSRFLDLEGPLQGTRYVRFDREGKGTLAGIPAGRYRISIDAWRKIGATWVEVPESGEAEARLVVRSAAPLAGRVTSQGRAPVADARVFAVDPGSDDLLETRTDRGGWFRFQVEHHPEARWEVLVVAPGGELVSLAAHPGDEDLAIVLAE